jgi:hypothetical protein
MPSGGARKGAGRKPKPLSEKLAAGNPGHRPLKKVEFTGNGGFYSHQPPEYLRVMEKREQRPGIPTPTELYLETVKYLEPSDCLNLIPSALIADYAIAKYHLLHSQYELGRTSNVVEKESGRKRDGNPNREFVLTDFAEAMLKMQKNVLSTWQPIWDIVSRNSERLVMNPEQDLMAVIVSGRARKKTRTGDAPDGYYADSKNPD